MTVLRTIWIMTLLVPAGGCADGEDWWRGTGGAPDQHEGPPAANAQVDGQDQEAVAPTGDLLLARKQRLEAENRRLRERIAELEARDREHRRGVEQVQAEIQRTRADLERQRRELDEAGRALRRSRADWERSLSDCRRQVDILTNQLERLAAAGDN